MAITEDSNVSCIYSAGLGTRVVPVTNVVLDSAMRAHHYQLSTVPVRQEDSGLVLSINGQQHPEQTSSSTYAVIARGSPRHQHTWSPALGADSVINVHGHQHPEQSPSSTYVVIIARSSLRYQRRLGVAPHEHRSEQTPLST